MEHKTSSGLSPTDVCRIFGVSKATLLRWEANDHMSQVPRDQSGNRYYTSKHVRELASSELRKLKHQYDVAARTENDQHMTQIHTKMQEYKFLSGQISGLQEMCQWGLSSERLRKLLIWLLQLSGPDERFFADALALLTEASRRMAAEGKDQP